MSEADESPPDETPVVQTPIEETPLAAAVPEPIEPQGVQFTGNGREYFQIWIVNLLLTIATLGVYSAWAKVRRLQYFHRHTRLAGAGFDYHGRPIAILKGRIVALILFGSYTVAGYFSPWHALGAAAVIALILPWLLAKSFRFRLHNTSYRGMRFHFHGTVRQAYWVFLALPVLAVLSLFILVPFVHQRMKRYQLAHAAYGRTRFESSPPLAEFYLTYLGTIGVFIGGLIFVFLSVMVAMLVAMAVGGITGDSQSPVAFGFIMVAAMLAYVVVFVSIQAFFTALIQNAVWNSTRLAEHRFVMRLSPARLFVVMFTNLLATIATIGLYRPFAQVRLARYYADSFVLVPGAPLEALLPDQSQDVSAVGEEAAELFDFDFSF